MKGKLFKRTLAVAVSVLMLTGGVSVQPYSGIFEDVAITAIAESNVTYLDAVGASQTCPTYTTVANSTTAWSNGWYVVSSNTTIADRVSVSGTVNLILCDGATLTASNGITVGNSATFNVYAQSEDEATMGVLNATTSETNNAGIGGTKSSSAGAITINGGKITAIGYYGAGIGSGCGYTVGTITINGGIIDAEDSKCYGAGIGGGSYGGKAGVIDLNGGIINAKGIGSGYSGGGSAITVNISSGVKEIVATSVRNGACIGQGYGASGSVNVVFKNNGSVVTGDAKDAVFHDSGEGTSRTIRSKVTNHSISISDEIKASVTADVSVAPQGSTVTLTLSMNVDESTLRVNDGTRDLTLTDIGNRQFTFVMPDADVTVTAIAQGEITYKLADGTPQTVSDFTEITDQVTWSSGTYAVTADTTISDRVTVSGEVHLILCDGVTLNCEKGITVAGDDSLTIYGCTAGTGTLTATADSRFSGIGGGDSHSGGTITINGGNISATGNVGAGIGGGIYAAGGNVTINGGTVTANSSNGGAGIGGGSQVGGGDPSVNTDGGMITINGGTVIANGSQSCAGIGGGERGAGGTITIRGGSITANGGSSGAGIGGGYSQSGGTISITGGTVTATGGTYGAGIGGGSGSEGAGGNITISGGNVDATGGSGAAGIGGGDECPEGTITLGWTNATDSIKATSYSGTVTFAKPFMIENGTRATASNIGGQTLIPLKSNVVIADSLNGMVIADKTSDVLFGETVTLTVTPDTGYGVKHVKYTSWQNMLIRRTSRTIPMNGSKRSTHSPFTRCCRSSSSCGDSTWRRRRNLKKTSQN